MTATATALHEPREPGQPATTGREAARGPGVAPRRRCPSAGRAPSRCSACSSPRRWSCSTPPSSTSRCRPSRPGWGPRRRSCSGWSRPTRSPSRSASSRAVAAGRPRRSQADVRPGARRLHRAVGGVRPRAQRGGAGRVPRAPGPRVGGDDPAGPVEHPGDVRPARAGQGDGPVHRPRRDCRRSLGPVVGALLTEADLCRAGAGARSSSSTCPSVSLAIVAALRWVPESVARQPPRLDARGVCPARRSLLAVLYPLTMGRELGWPAWVYAVMAAGVVGPGRVRVAAAPGRVRGSRAARRAEPLPRSRVRGRARAMYTLHVRRDGRAVHCPDDLLPGRPRLVGAQGRARGGAVRADDHGHRGGRRGRARRRASVAGCCMLGGWHLGRRCAGHGGHGPRGRRLDVGVGVPAGLRWWRVPGSG